MLYFMKNKLVFEITYEDGMFTACASDKNYAIITDGGTFDELKKNIQEATELALEGEEFGIDPHHVSLVGNFAIPFPR